MPLKFPLQVQRFRGVRGTVDAYIIRAALEAAGVQFVEPGVDPLGPGVALRP